MESWQSGNATDLKSVEPVHTVAQVQILYSLFLPKITFWDNTGGHGNAVKPAFIFIVFG